MEFAGVNDDPARGTREDFAELARPPKLAPSAQSLAATARSAPRWGAQNFKCSKHRKPCERADPRLQETEA
eukprot:8405530-Pyramimonas_sp.AAC.1